MGDFESFVPPERDRILRIKDKQITRLLVERAELTTQRDTLLAACEFVAWYNYADDDCKCFQCEGVRLCEAAIKGVARG